MPKITPLGYFGRFVGLIFVGAFIVSMVSMIFPDGKTSERDNQYMAKADRFLYSAAGEH